MKTIKNNRKTTKISKATRRAYGPDTEGMELPEANPKLSTKQQKAKDAAFIKKAKKGKAPKYVNKTKEYAGKPVEATRLYSRRMGEFKNTEAAHLIAVNDDEGTVTHLNTYRGGVLPASYNAASYTYPIKNQEKLEAKLKEFEEVDKHEWPYYVVTTGKRSRKAK